MILLFDYPKHRSIYDRRLWSAINCSLIFENKNRAMSHADLKVTVLKKNNPFHFSKSTIYNLNHQEYYGIKKQYFTKEQLKELSNIIIKKCNLGIEINNFIFHEEYIHTRPKIKLEFLPKESK